MSCGQIALKKLGIKVSGYYASEIDKHAIQVAKENFPDTIHLGDVTKVEFTKLGSIDLLLGGSPCQGFSFAGKMFNFDDPRSKLFFEYARALKVLKPKYFLLENVKMKKESERVISETLGVEPIEINSSLLSAQSRRRLYWTNIPVTAPEDKGIKLRDILESNPKDPVFLSESTKERFIRYGVPLLTGDEDKARCLAAMEYVKNGKQGNYLKCSSKSGLQFLGGLDGGIRLDDGKFYSRNFREGYRVYGFDGKAATLTSQNKGGPGGFSGLYADDSSEDFRIRKLTVTECKRLQTVPDDYLMNVSNSQAYKMLGNGWTIDVIAHILKGMEK